LCPGVFYLNPSRILPPLQAGDKCHLFSHSGIIYSGIMCPYWIGELEVIIMKEGIHPGYYQAKVVCNCGNEFITGSTKEEIHVEICSKCHSFYTGQQKTVKARGAIDKFNRRYGIQAD